MSWCGQLEGVHLHVASGQNVARFRTMRSMARAAKEVFRWWLLGSNEQRDVGLVRGPGGWSQCRIHHRLFYLTDVAPPGSEKPYLVIVAGLSKNFRTTFSDRDYAKVRRLGATYWSSAPRSVT